MAINSDVLMHLTQGVYLLGAKSPTGFVGCVVDAVMTVATQPTIIGLSCMNTGFTKEQIEQTQKFSLSVLPANVAPSVCETFGYHSSRDTDKWKTIDMCEKDGLPIYKKAISYLTAEVKDKKVFDSHTLFLAEVVSADILDEANEKPLTYADYRTTIRPKIQSACETKSASKWVCTVCGYTYDGDVPFEELPDDWVCPICGVGKNLFECT